MSSHELGFFLTKKEKKKKKKNALQVENDQIVFDFSVDEGKERLNPSRVKNEGKHRRRKEEKSCETPAGTSTNNLTSRINGMTTQHKLRHCFCF